MSPTALDVRPLAAKAVDVAVTATRLPLSLFEQVRGEEVRATWPPVRVVNAVDAVVLDVAGRALDEPRLVARANLLRASVQKATEADALAAEAERVRREADGEFDRRRQAARRREEEAEEQADQERRRVEQAADAEERSARERARRRDEVADKRDRERERQVARQERAATKTKVAQERKALAAERKALAAEAQALSLDDAVDTAKAKRRNGR